MSRTIKALRAVVVERGLTSFYAARDLVAEHDADPLRFALLEFLAAHAAHRETLPSGKRRTFDRIAGNVRRLEKIV